SRTSSRLRSSCFSVEGNVLDAGSDCVSIRTYRRKRSDTEKSEMLLMVFWLMRFDVAKSGGKSTNNPRACGRLTRRSHAEVVLDRATVVACPARRQPVGQPEYRSALRRSFCHVRESTALGDHHTAGASSGSNRTGHPLRVPRPSALSSCPRIRTLFSAAGCCASRRYSGGCAALLRPLGGRAHQSLYRSRIYSNPPRSFR